MVVKVTRPSSARWSSSLSLPRCHGTPRGVLEVLATALEALVVDLHPDDRETVAGEHLGDPGTHRPETDDADRGELAGRGGFGRWRWSWGASSHAHGGRCREVSHTDAWPRRDRFVPGFRLKWPFRDLPSFAAFPEMDPVPVRHSLDPSTYRLRPVATRPWAVPTTGWEHSILTPMGPAFPAHYVRRGHGSRVNGLERRRDARHAHLPGPLVSPVPQAAGERGDLVGAAPRERRPRHRRGRSSG